MRYFWALLAYVTAIVVAAASCGGSGNTGGTGFTNSGGTGGNSSGTSSANGGAGTGADNSTGALMFPDSGPPPPTDGCAAQMTCAQQGLNCGMATDGCGNVIDCGTCTAPETCAGSGTQNVCGKPNCTPGTCMSFGYNCGSASDGCNGTLSCGTCPGTEVCGSGGTNVCGNGTCMPKSCVQQGYNCGNQGDTCGNSINCGTCPSGQVCGGGMNPMTGVCGMATTCMPKTCAQQGFNCGMATDTCGTIINCGSCTGSEVCGASMGNVCGSTTSCTGLCTQQTTCPGMGTTSITGKVYAPNGVDPVYNSLVYVPNGGPAPTYGVQPFVDGVAVPHCSCGSDVTGSPLVSTATAVDGSFTLTNMPVGANIPLVIQNGRWRRQITIPNVVACTNTAVAATLTHMPTSKAQGNIPKMAFSTGSVDSLECVMRKIGILDTEFTNPGGTGRVQFFQGIGSDPFNPILVGGGAVINGSTPGENQLWSTQAAINQYDMVLFPCQGEEFDQAAASQQNVINYANAGGRVFTTHYSYVWLFNDSPFSTTAAWDVSQIPEFDSDPENGTINQTFPKGLALAQWLKLLYPASVQGQIQLNTLRNDFDAVNAPSSLWISITDSFYTNVPMHYTFDTPVGTPPAQQCGRVLFDDFHVEDAENTPTQGVTFPGECNNNAMTPQEKMLEFMLFDLGSCVTPPMCTPKTCAQQATSCGPVGDGCGNIIMCGMCPSGQVCTGGVCNSGGCVPKTCAQQGFTCGNQGDGCGNTIPCGTCPSGTCGGGGMEGVCGSGTCTPKTCMAQNIACGETGDGCGNIINCGVCPAGEICGGNNMPGQCYKPPCTPKTCTQLGFNCGSASDGCGNIIMCGACSGSQTCGGGGQSNICGGGAG